jgi:hypothetical protein
MSRRARGNSLKAGSCHRAIRRSYKLVPSRGCRVVRLRRSFALPSYFHTVVTMRKMQRLQRKMNVSIRFSLLNSLGAPVDDYRARSRRMLPVRPGNAPHHRIASILRPGSPPILFMLPDRSFSDPSEPLIRYFQMSLANFVTTTAIPSI